MKPGDIDANESGLRIVKPMGLQSMETGIGASAGVDGRVVESLLGQLKRYAGFKSTPTLQRKLVKVLSGTPPDELVAWLSYINSTKDRDELNALIEDLTNHETFFFRDKSQLDLVSEMVFAPFFKSIRDDRRYTFRILSAACSSGEEAYTLAILFIESAIAAGCAKREGLNDYSLAKNIQLDVVGLDISRQAVRRAQDAVYAKNGLASFRDMPEKYWSFFEEIKGGHVHSHTHTQNYYSPIRGVKKYVRFHRHNLVESIPVSLGKFDLMLCRNAMIYIDHEKQKVIQDNMTDALLKGGHLVLSAVDTLHRAKKFSEIWRGNALCYRKSRA